MWSAARIPKSCAAIFPGWSEAPAKAAGLPVPELVVLKSPFRFIVRPILDYALELEEDNPDKTIAVLIPELVESRWYYFLLHNNRSQVLKALLLFSGNERTTVINIPWYLHQNKGNEEAGTSLTAANSSECCPCPDDRRLPFELYVSRRRARTLPPELRPQEQQLRLSPGPLPAFALPRPPAFSGNPAMPAIQAPFVNTKIGRPASWP